MRAFYVFIVPIFIILATNVLAEEPQSLKEWDSVAFAAYENNQGNVLEIAEQFKEASLKHPPSIYQVNAYTLLGIINKNKGYYVSSVEYYNEALKVAGSIGDQRRVSACYNNIGSVYQIQENYEKALYYFKKSLEIEEQINTPLQKSIRLYNLGEVYRELDSLTLALSHFNSSLIIEKNNNNDEGIVYALLGIADIYIQLDRAADADLSLSEAKPFLSESNIETQILFNIKRGDIHFLQDEFDKSLARLKKAKSLSEKHDVRIYLMDIYEKEIEVKTTKDKLQTESAKKDKKRSNSYSWILAVLIGMIPVIFILKYARKKGSASTPTEDSSCNTDSEELIFVLKNNKGRIQFEIEVTNIICFEANDNYVNIHYLKDGNLLKTMERISLRKIEGHLSELGISFHRVHKSFLINHNFIDKIKGRSQAYKLAIEHLDFEIPVSRKFDISGLNT